MTNTFSFAQRELDILVKSATDPENRPLIEPFIPEILALCEKFGRSGQSGGSAPFTATVLARAIKKLCLQEPIMPITNLPEEWVNVSEYSSGEILFQNRRCSAMFKRGDNERPYYLDAIVFKDEKGVGFTSNGSVFLKDGSTIYSRNYIKIFPFTPRTFYIDVVSFEIEKDNWEHKVKNESQLKAVWKYYDRYEKI